MTLGTGSGIAAGKVQVTLKRGVLALQQTVADPQGDFVFDQLTEGDYEVVIESPGYQTYRRRVGLRYPGHEEERFSVRLAPLEPAAHPGGTRQHISPEAINSFQRGVSASRAGKHEAAAEHYARAVSIAPDYLEAWNNLGGEYRMLERWEKAEEALQRARALDPESAQVNLNLGMLYLAQGKTAKARNHLKEAVRREPQLSRAHLLMGVIAYQEGDMEEARGELERALEADPGATPEAKVYLASILAGQGKFSEAAGLLEEFLQRHPSHAQAGNANRLLQKIRDVRREGKNL